MNVKVFCEQCGKKLQENDGSFSVAIQKNNNLKVVLGCRNCNKTFKLILSSEATQDYNPTGE